MTPKEQAQLRKYVKDSTPSELVARHSAAITAVEMIWAEVAARLDKEAGNNRLCSAAISACHAREMMHTAKAFHSKADYLAASFGGDIPGGEPVLTPFAGGRG